MRSDGLAVRGRLLEAIGEYVAVEGVSPSRLADVAERANVGVGTAYRHFSSIEEAVNAYLVRLPMQAVARFARGDRPNLSARDRFETWNRSWVGACIAHGPIAVRLRSSEGFLARRREQEPAVMFVCAAVEPLLNEFAGSATDRLELLWVWNALSDPREVLDQHLTRRRSARSIAAFITAATIASVR
jgi:AcrR family transcriptional regulator